MQGVNSKKDGVMPDWWQGCTPNERIVNSFFSKLKAKMWQCFENNLFV